MASFPLEFVGHPLRPVVGLGGWLGWEVDAAIEAVRGDFFGMRSEMIRASEQTETAAAWRQYQERP